MNQKTGLEAVFETKEFKKGLEIYKQGLRDADQLTDKSSQGIGKSGEQVGGLTAALGGVGPAALLAGGALVALGATVIQSVINTFKEAIAVTREFIVESINIASRWEELDMVAQLMGQRVGMTSEEIRQLSSDMEEAGIRGDVASKAIANFVRMEMDPNFALELGKAAQNLAILAQDGADSSDVLDRLMLGIQRLSPLILRTAGANVDLQTEFKNFAAEMGIVGRELTQIEKQQAAYNAVLKSAATVQGAYEVAMDSAGKQMRSLTGREIPTLQAALGAPFQGAFLNVASAARKVVQTFTEAIQEGGILYPVMVRLGAIADIITDALKNLAVNGAQAVVDFFSWLTGTFSDGTQSAFEWGFELVVNFAQGIVDAAASVLVDAINFIGSILAGWLAPGSPPKVAPDIIKWGAGAMTEYLKGFSKADFSSLKNIASPLKSALDIMVQAGQATKAQVTKTFLDLNKAISGALASDKGPSESLFKKIAKEAGQFGKEIAALARGEFALAKATDEVAEAQERVNEAMEKQQEAEKAVRDLTGEYNRLLRAGASDEILKAKLAEINAAEDAAIIAAQEKKSAEEGLTEKEDALAVMKEQVELQSQLVKQLLDLAKMAILPGELPLAEAGAGVPGLEGAGAGAGFEIDTDAISSKMREAVEAAKQAFLERWADVKATVKAQFMEAFGPAIEEVQIAWSDFMVIASQFYEENLKPVFDDIREWVETTLPAAWDTFIQAGTDVWSWYQENMVPILKDVWQILSDIGDIIATYVNVQWQNMLTALTNLKPYLEEAWTAFTDIWESLELVEAFQIGWNNALSALETGLGVVHTALVEFHEWLLKVKEVILNMPVYRAVTKESPVPMAEGLKAVNLQLAKFQRNLLLTKGMITDLNMASSVISPTMAGQSIIQPSSTRVFQMEQNNTIQSPMDMATFRAMFNQVIREQFSGV